MKRRGYKEKAVRGSPEDFYREAHSMSERSARSKSGPAQVEVIKNYSAAARGFENKGDFYKARKVLREAVKYLDYPKRFSGSATNPKLIKKINDRLNEINKKLPIRKSRGLERRLFALAFLTIASFVIALFFISFNLTGYSIGGLTQENFRWIGTSSFILGLVFAFFYFKNKK